MIMDFLRDLWNFLKVRKKFWLLPLIIVLLLVGVLIVLTSSSAIAPFIYTIF
jgi:competence protein ComGC